MTKIRFEHVTKQIKGITVLADISLTLEGGLVYGLFGGNGSGKTMFLRAIAGLIRPTQGYVMIDEQQLHKDMRFPESIGVLIETPDFWKNYTGREVLIYLSEIKKQISHNDVDTALKRVGLNPSDTRTIRKYSLGMKQRLGIAQAIMEDPDILLLDEPSNALDRAGKEMLMQIIREEAEKGHIVVLASHNDSDLKICDTIIEIADGKVEEIRENEEKTEISH